MNGKKLSLIMLMLIGGCEDKIYDEAVQSEIQDTATAIPIAVETTQLISAQNFSGVVEVGVPISGAAVSVYKFNERVKGEKIGDAVSNTDGSYTISLSGDPEEPLLLVARGGIYRDLSTKENISLRPEQELRSVVPHLKSLERTNINAWTTLAVARVMANVGFWDKSVANLKLTERVEVDFAHMSHFLQGKRAHSINISHHQLLDVQSEKISLNDPRLTMHLAHAGLSQLAREFSERLSGDGVSVSQIDLIVALTKDLSDRVFDGKDANGEIVYVGLSRKINLSSYTTRKDLAEAIYRYAKQLRASNRISEDDFTEMKAAGRMIDSLASDARPELFPEQDKPLPIDVTVPELVVHFAGAHKYEKHFGVLDGDVVFDIETKYQSKVEKLILIAPELPKVDGDSFGPVTIEHVQNSAEVAIACDKRSEFENDLKKWATRKESVTCACFEAVDTRGNKQRELSCFRRDEPRVQIKAPTDQLVLDRNDLRRGIRLNASASSGAALVECHWAFYNQFSDAPALRGEGITSGASCLIDENISAAPLRSGDYLFVVRTRDVAGRVPNVGNTVSLQIRHDLMRFPGRTLDEHSKN